MENPNNFVNSQETKNNSPDKQILVEPQPKQDQDVVYAGSKHLLSALYTKKLPGKRLPFHKYIHKEVGLNPSPNSLVPPQVCFPNVDGSLGVEDVRTVVDFDMLMQEAEEFSDGWKMPFQEFDLVIPGEVVCPLCHQVMKDAVLASKCCFKSFCGACMREYLVQSKSQCVCGAADVSADNLIPNFTLRDAITRILMETGIGYNINAITFENAKSHNSKKVEEMVCERTSSSATSSAGTQQKVDTVADALPNDDEDNKAKFAGAPKPVEEVTSDGIPVAPKPYAIEAIPISCYRVPYYPDSNLFSKDQHQMHGMMKNASIYTRSPGKNVNWQKNWIIHPRQRPNGRVDKYYYHKETNVMCRSLVEVDHYELYGVLPNQMRRKKKQDANASALDGNASALPAQASASDGANKATLKRKRMSSDNNLNEEIQGVSDSPTTPNAEMQKTVEDFLKECHENQIKYLSDIVDNANASFEHPEEEEPEEVNETAVQDNKGKNLVTCDDEASAMPVKDDLITDIPVDYDFLDPKQ